MRFNFDKVSKADLLIGGRFEVDVDYGQFRNVILFTSPMREGMRIQSSYAIGLRNVSTVLLAKGLGQDDESYPLKVADDVVKSFAALGYKPETICLDMTSFTPEVVQILLASISINFDEAEVFGFYNEATARDVASEFFVGSVPKIRSVIGFPGMLSPAQKSHLILTTGFHPWLIHHVVSEFEPSSLTVCWHTAADDVYKQDVMNRLMNCCSDLRYSSVSNNPTDACKEFQQLVDADKNNIFIVCGDTRYAAGVALVVLSKPDYQICCVPTSKLK